MTPVPVVIVQSQQRARAPSPLTMLDWNDDHYSTCELDVNEEEEYNANRQILLEEEETEEEKDNDDEDEDVPQEFICPLTLEVMATPMMTRTGQNYERHAILCWLENHTHCPLTRQPLSLRDCVINSALGLKIQKWQQQQEQQQQRQQRSSSRDDNAIKSGEDVKHHDVDGDADIFDGYLAQCCAGSAKDDLGLLCSCAPSKDLIDAIERRDDLDSQILAQILKNARKHMKQEHRQRQQQQRQRELRDQDRQRQQRQQQSNARNNTTSGGGGSEPAVDVAAERTDRRTRGNRRFRNRFGFSSLRATAA